MSACTLLPARARRDSINLPIPWCRDMVGSGLRVSPARAGTSPAGELGWIRSPLPMIHEAKKSRAVPPMKVAATEMWWERGDLRMRHQSMMESWMAPTMRPPPLSGSSLMPFASQLDQQTGDGRVDGAPRDHGGSDCPYVESHGEKSYGDGREKQRQSHDQEVEMVAQQRACSVRCRQIRRGRGRAIGAKVAGP